jgi:hypothetical protein
MTTRIKYKTNGLGETIYYPQRKVLGLWKSFREPPPSCWDDWSVSVKRESIEAAREVIADKLIRSLGKKTAVKGVIE